MSSRIIIKNVPKHITLDRFRQHFEAKGEVTDAKIMKTNSGKSRLFGFIGFKSPEQAAEAAKFFDRTFLDTSRILVELAKPMGDPKLDRPWSAHSKGSSAFTRRLKAKENRKIFAEDIKKRKRGETTEEKEKEKTEDPQLAEFLEVMKPKSQTKFWSNDDVLTATIANEIPTKKVEAKVAQVENKRPGGKGIMLKKTHVKFDDDESEDELYEEMPDVEMKEEEEALKEEDKTLVNDPGISDLDYLKARTVKNIDKMFEDEEEEEEVEEEPSPQKKKVKKEEVPKKETKPEPKKETPPKKETKPEPKKEATELSAKKLEEESDDIGKTGRLFVRNLSYLTTEEELTDRFRTYGPIAEIHIPINKETKLPKGIAFVQYMNPTDAVRALNETDGKIFQGRLLHVIPAKTLLYRREKSESATNSYKQKKEQDRKAKSTTEQHTWNSLFMGSDAVAESIAARLGVTKADVLDRDASNVAVRLALAETQIINETKEFLEKQGVSLDSLGNHGNKSVQRSSTIILVKNIPYSTDEKMLRKAFDKFGGISRVVLPPARTIALVEFHEPTEAKSAFKGLAYKQFNGVPMYLEWAPVEVFKEKPPAPAAPEPVKKEEPKERVSKDEVANAEEENTDGSTLYVKNLNFETTETALEKFFNSIGGIRRVTIAKKKDPKNASAMLSRGYGFVEFYSRDDAVKALKTLQGKELNSHALEMKFSGQSGAGAGDNKKKKESASLAAISPKLLIRNLPFEASKQELRELFKPFGQVKRVTIPKKMGNNFTLAGKSRGFGFVEFNSKVDAQRAFESLKNTHLYGRHLVLEFAKDERQEAMEGEVIE